jgi:hypothetical protein
MSYEIDRYEEHKNDGRKGFVISFVGLILLAFAVIVMMLTGCTTIRYVPVVEHRTDTVQITRQQRDSIWLHDSIYMKEYMSGDTVYLLRDRWHTKYIENLRHDTTYISKRDTIPCPYPVEVEVEKQLTWWQRFRLSMANMILWFLLIWGVALGLKTYWKKFL